MRGTGQGARIRALEAELVATRSAADAEIAALRAALADASRTCEAVAGGDFEARMGPTDDPRAAELRTTLNRVLDRTDMFLRETAAASTAAADGRFYRRFVTTGMAGSYATAADAIDVTRSRLAAAAEQSDQVARERSELADALEARILTLSSEVATAAGSLSATADDLATSAEVAVSRTTDAAAAMSSLAGAGTEIAEVTKAIGAIAGQVRMLSLNARIEAARAGEAGKGFTVITSEIGNLAGDTEQASERIGQRVATALDWARQALDGSERVATAVSGMDVMTGTIADAARGSDQEQGLAQMAETLRTEVAELVAAIRQR